jgi:D-glycero-alpha-D-manno-heptose 1-phosphate guanylyltransferase
VKCVVLAGGFGTRLRGLFPSTPKCLVPLGKKTFLEHHLDTLADHGVTAFILALGHLAEAVITETAGWTKHYAIHYSVEKTPLGTGGAVRRAFDQYELSTALVVNGDTLLQNAEMSGMMRALNADRGEWARIAAMWVQDRSRYGGIERADDRVMQFLEKGVSGAGYVSAGVYQLSRAAIDVAASLESFSLETLLLPELVKRRALGVALVAGDFVDIGVPEDYQRLERAYA